MATKSKFERPQNLLFTTKIQYWISITYNITDKTFITRNVSIGHGCPPSPLFHLCHKNKIFQTNGLACLWEGICWVFPTRQWKYPTILTDRMNRICYLLFSLSVSDSIFLCMTLSLVNGVNYSRGSNFVISHDYWKLIFQLNGLV